MKTVCKKLLMLMLVAVLLVSVVPAAFAADPVEVKVHVTLDGTVINTSKKITIMDGETKNLTKELAQPMINDWTNREFVNWSPLSAIDYATASAAVAADPNYHLTINLKSCVWDAGVQTKAPTCTEKGIKTFTCTSCGATKTQDIPALGHAFSTTPFDTKDPTCTADGYYKYKCTHSDCSEVKTDVRTALGHNLDAGTVTKAATCTVKGELTKKCTNAGCTYTEKSEIPLADHTYVDAICTVCGHGSRAYTLTFKYLNENGNWVTETQDIHNSETIEFPITPSVKGKRITGWGNEKNGTIYRTDSTYTWRVSDPVQFTAQYTETTDDNLATLTVWANFYVDGEYHHREQLLTKDFAKSSTSNSMFTWLYSEEGLTQVRDQVFAGGANSGYQWANQIYYNYFGDAAITEASMKADGDKHVYIKVTSTKSMEAKVMLYVHLKQTETVDRIIAMPGYTAGDYVSYSAVKSAVKTKYTGSNMTVSDLYTENEWDRLMDGQKASGAASVKVLDNGTTEIHVIVKNAKSSSSSTADPSNPKTGDYIIIAVGTMALAGAALVTMAELKKRKKI